MKTKTLPRAEKTRLSNHFFFRTQLLFVIFTLFLLTLTLVKKVNGHRGGAARTSIFTHTIGWSTKSFEAISK